MSDLDRWIIQQLRDPKLWVQATCLVVFAWAVLVLTFTSPA